MKQGWLGKDKKKFFFTLRGEFNNMQGYGRSGGLREYCMFHTMVEVYMAEHLETECASAM